MKEGAAFRKLPKTFVMLFSAGLVAAFAYALWPVRRNVPERPAQPSDAAGVAMLPPDATFEQWVQHSNQFMDQGAFPAAIAGYSEALDLDSMAVDVWVDRGACRHALSDFMGAEHDFRMALSIQSDHVTARFNLGIVFFSSGRLDSARVYWTWVTATAPESGEAVRARKLLVQLEASAQ